MFFNIHFLSAYADNRGGMLSHELKDLLFQVIKSWQVLAVTVVLVLYIYLVKYVSRSYHRPRMSKTKSRPKVKKEKVEAEKPAENPDELVIE